MKKVRRELKEGYPYAYVWNREEEFGEIGSIQIKMEQGGLVRVAEWNNRFDGTQAEMLGCFFTGKITG